MTDIARAVATDTAGRSAGRVTAALFVAVVALGVIAGLDKVVAIALVACIAMGAGALFGYRSAGRQVYWQALDGVAGGAMIAAACVLLLPQAIELDALFGGIGVTVGLLCALMLHRACRNRAQQQPDAFGESSLVALTAHSAGAGVVIGMLYARMPDLGLWLGTVIVVHKLPAGYAVARRLRTRGAALASVALPACIVGIVAIPVALAMAVLPPSLAVGAACQGVATGLFMHVGLECVALDGPGAADVTPAGWRIWLPVGVGMALMLALRVLFG